MQRKSTMPSETPKSRRGRPKKTTPKASPKGRGKKEEKSEEKKKDQEETSSRKEAEVKEEKEVKKAQPKTPISSFFGKCGVHILLAPLRLFISHVCFQHVRVGDSRSLKFVF